MKEILDVFINKLIADTLAETYSWHHLSDLYGTTEESNKGIFILLIENEYRHIDYDLSYYCPVPEGNIFLIYEMNESGRDGTQTNKYQLYIQNENNTDVIKISINPTLVYQLAYAVKSKDNSEEIAVNFIKNFVNRDSKNCQ